VDLNREYKQNRRNSFIFKLIKYFGLKKIKYANHYWRLIPYETTHGNNLMPSFIEDL
jgi:hypothetical protein